jgi:hypothetical protein
MRPNGAVVHVPGTTVAPGYILMREGAMARAGPRSALALRAVLAIAGSILAAATAPPALWPLALLSLGESRHNMHHSDPACARHGADSRQIDVFAVIRVFERLGWAASVHWPVPARWTAAAAIRASVPPAGAGAPGRRGADLTGRS